ncbi:DUF2059 domain-containing protein [Aestuariibaculum lutulentum]|uniref:DUF2059 domain-containing protein n=1 Tax=Aestuariibaculum lutulentum TaxID=2920935 RepID=A0ABS9RGL8_9FLAO|nr:DUF2059 domain-containing protein [Aestuariibaculum lutulentum]MCH4552090.1 DUF2059 domain-containing protein [Aestuariibaculum lutulentum]
MKNLLFACLFVVGTVGQVFAQDNSEFKNETINFIKLTGSTTAFETAISQIGSMVSEDKKEVYMEEAKGTLDGLYQKMAGLYMAEFTREEIQELTAFYKTDLGKKLANKQYGLAQKAMMFGQSWGMEVQAIAQKYM